MTPDHGVTSSEPPWKSLHPGSLAVNLLPRTWSVVRQVWPLLVVVAVGGRADGASLVDLGILGFFLASTVGATVVHMLTLRYRMIDGRLEIKSGLLQRQARVISPRKIQNVELVRNVFHRLTGLVEVRLETASGTEVEGLLSALREDEALALVDALSRARGRGEPVEDAANLPVVAHNDLRDLTWYGASATRFGAALVVLGVVFEGMSAVDPERAARIWVRVGAAGAVAATLTAMIGAWLGGIVSAIVRHHAFRLTQHDDRLVAEEGLFTLRRAELPVRKVQVVTVEEPWLRRALGFGSVLVETAAARPESGGTEQAVTMVPLVRREDMQRVVEAALPQIDLHLTTAELERPDRRVLVRAVVRSVVQGVVVAGFAAWWWWPWGLLGSVGVPALVTLAWLDWSRQGWLVTEQVVVSRRGYLNRVTRILARDKLQSVELEQGPILRRYGLAEVVLRAAGSAVVMPLIDHERAFALVCQLSATTARSAPASAARDEVTEEVLLLDDDAEP